MNCFSQYLQDLFHIRAGVNDNKRLKLDVEVQTVCRPGCGHSRGDAAAAFGSLAPRAV